MKRIIPLLVLFLLSGCAAAPQSHTASKNTVQNVIEQQISKSSASASASSVSTQSVSVSSVSTRKESIYTSVDIDLTKLNADMTYAQIYDMSMNPDAYMGKVIKMSGIYSRYQMMSTAPVYKTCIVQDALACCAQGIEFKEVDGSILPPSVEETNSPELSTITIVGTFNWYTEEHEGMTYRYMELLDTEVQ